ncbi:MAG: Smr/MutS family protein [Candidatus Krumholzibacteriales bacterium]
MNKPVKSELSHTLRKLEFGAVLEIISGRAASARAAEFIKDIHPLDSRDDALRRQREIMELVDFRTRGGDKLPVSGWEDTRDILEAVISEGQILDCEQLVIIARGEQYAGKVRKFIESNRELLPIATGRTSRMKVSSELSARILSIIDEDYQLLDNASPKLRELRRRITGKRSSLRKKFDEFAERSGSSGGADFVTVRGGRYVVSVQKGGGKTFRGIVHHQSGSGQSVFIEPLELIGENNEMESLLQEERKEIHRILRDITRAVYENREAMLVNQDTLFMLDIMNAAASFALEFECCIPDHSSGGRMVLKNARHPLLEMELKLENRSDDLVGLNMECGDDLRVVVISGPNAGGKSVSLKTIGLLILMDQSGLPVPARPGTVIPECSGVLVDIGDDQSIKKSLSTFSSRIVRIKSIISCADPSSVVLIDEIGDGTSHEEGEVLAEAVLEKLTGISGRIFVTTHFTSLKSWAYEREEAENATLEFDPDNLKPLYRMKLGIPGRSWGIETAARLGIGQDLVRSARKRLKSGSRSLEGLLAELEKKREQLDRQLETAESERERMAGLAAEYREKLEEFEENRRELEDQARKEALEIISGAGAEIEKLVSSIKSSQASADSIKEARSSLRDRKEELERKIRESEKRDRRPVPERVEPGMRVRISSLGKTGKVVSVDGPERIFVELEGGIKVETDRENLTAAPGHKKKRRKVSWTASVAEPVKPEIMVRGMVKADALELIDRYIDQAVLQGVETVRIIHGIGEGVLRKAIYENLKDDPRIADINPGEPAFGGDGVAVVKLK